MKNALAIDIQKQLFKVGKVMRQFLKLLAACTVATLFAACGGGGGSSGSTGNGGGSTPPINSTVADMVLLLDKATLTNTGAENVKLTIIAVDASNNVVTGATASVATDANTVYTPTSTTSDTSGKIEGTIGIGSDKSDRLVTVKVTIGAKTKQTTFQVQGSKLALTVTPAVVAPGAAGTASVRVTDAASVAIPNKTVVFSGSLFGSAQPQATTNSNGFAEVPFTAPASAGSYVVRVAASGTTTQSNVQVGNSAVIPDAALPADTSPSLDSSPNVLAPNLQGSTTNQAQLRFLALTPANLPIRNVRVRFEIISTGLGSSDSTLSTGSSTVYTDASGVATSSLIAGPNGSPTNGVVVRACYQANEFTAPNQCDKSVQTTLTIASQPLAVSVGDDNLLERGSGTYIKRFVVSVADSAGRAVAGAPVDISLDLTHYGKGSFIQTPTFSLSAADIYRYIPEPTGTPAVYPAPGGGLRVTCVNEDRNRNGAVDPGENINGSVDSTGGATLEPRRSDIIISYNDPTVKTTNASGLLQIKVEYSQRYATWIAYRIKASTSVAGSQGMAERAFVTDYIEGDQVNGSFLTPPYGSGSCSSPN